MSDKKLIDTIKHKLSLGVPEDEIIETLVSFGWDDEEVRNTLSTLNFDSHKPTTPLMPQTMMAQPPIDNGPKIVFAGEPSSSEPEKKSGSGSQIIVTALIILITLAGTAAFIFLDEIKKIAPLGFSIESIVEMISGKKEEPAQEPPPIVQPPIQPSDNSTMYGPYDVAGGISLSENKFIFYYEKTDEQGSYQYVNINGSPYGPYQKKGTRPIVPSLHKGNFGFSYYDGKEQAWYVNINGNVNGPYSEVSNVYYSEHGYIYASKKKDAIYYYINVNGKEDIGKPYVSIGTNTYLADDGTYGFSYISNDKLFINMSEKIYGPYDKSVEKNLVFRDKKFYFPFSEDTMEYVNINGDKFDGRGTTIYDQAKNEFEFRYIKDGKKYVNINGKESLDEESAALKAHNYYKKDSEYFVNAGTNKGPYKKTTLVAKNGESYAFGYQLEDGKWYVSINGNGVGPYQDILPTILMNSKNDYGFAFLHEGKWYVQIKQN
ncbi:MAG: hypothetical protein BWY21_00756 [Parcubacteria group bacterium ADurb.Bin216]|nr:MAG: hypothetical protein BWY21_00756 [Parcubacteria group bacterium ADurb.Bin216]